ncbi:MAG: tetratricopeptide repeat protein [Pseudomonadota bacterium]
MPLTDCRGVPVSTDNATALAALEEAHDLFLGYFNDPLAPVEEALAEDPSFVMGHCYRAGLHVISSEKGAVPELAKSVEAAEALSATANERERGHMAAARAWLAGDYHRAAALYGEVLVKYPHDLIALQIGHQCDFLLGQSSMLRDRVSWVLPQWSESQPGYGYLLGMHAFGLEEMGDYGRAEQAGRRAVEICPGDTWAIHAVAHVLEMQGRLEEGVEWLAGRSDDWSPDNGFAFHNWWHLALYHLDLGQVDRVLELYDQSIHPAPTEVALELVDAVSLLWRLRLRGIDVGNRWTELADTYEPVAEDGYYAFNDMHAMMCFTADERPAAADRLLQCLERTAGGTDSNAMMTREVGLPVARAIKAFARGDYGTCVSLLLPVRALAHRFGGSHAQRDVIQQTLIEATLRDGNGALGRALANERTQLKPTSAFNWSSTARAASLLGDGAGAERATARAHALQTTASVAA